MTKSIFDFVDKAVIKIPISARVSISEKVTETVDTAKQFTEGDAVKIDLGYNGIMQTEFTGFVSKVNLTAPLEIECEGYSYQLRKKTYKRTFKDASLKEILGYLVSGTDIVLDNDIPDFKIQKLILEDHAGNEVLNMIRKISEETIRFYFTGNVLYAGLVYVNPDKDVKYRMGWNVIKDNNLKLKEAKNTQVTINVIGEKKDGTKVNAQARTEKPGEVKTIRTHAITDYSTCLLYTSPSPRD